MFVYRMKQATIGISLNAAAAVLCIVLCNALGWL